MAVEAEQAGLASYRADLKPAQLEVLRWIAEGCPDGRYEGYSHRVSAAALRTRGLVRISGHGPSWNAELTERGSVVVQLPDPTPGAVRPAATRKQTPAKPAAAPHPRTLSKTEQLIADLIAAGGVLQVPYWREQGEPDFRQRAIAAERFGKVPADKRLVLERVRGGQLEIRLEDALPGSDIDLEPVPVPARLSRPHPVAARYRDATDQHLVSRAMLSRSVRIIHALAAEAERRGHRVASSNMPVRERSARSSAREPVPHLVITVGNHAYSISISEEKVSLRGVWEERKRIQDENRLRYPYYGGSERLKRYDADATGQLSITLVASGHKREGRADTWSDRKSWTLEEKLPELLRELELRTLEDDEREAEEKRRAEERQRQWEQQIDRAKQRYIETHRANVLRAQLAARQEAQVMRSYLAELEAAHGDRPESAEWIDWIRAFITSIDPLSSPPSMPEEPEISREDLKPFLPRGVNPYGPERW
jgi:hypothetical protein